MSADLFARLVEGLHELSGKVGARIVAGMRYFAYLPIRPISRVGLLSRVIAGQILVVNLLLDLAVRANGTRFRDLSGSVVVHFDFSVDAVIPHFGVLGDGCGYATCQKRQ